MKADVRFLGVDDAPFRKGDATVPLVGVVTRGPQYIEGVLTTRIRVDGDDATHAFLRMVLASRFRPLVRAVFLNGIFAGGLNVIDPDAVHAALGVPVVALVRSAPRPDRVRAAVRRALPEPEAAWARIERLVPERLPGRPLWATLRGVDAAGAAELVAATVVRGHLPEPLRLAHVIASGFVRGESRGRA